MMTTKHDPLGSKDLGGSVSLGFELGARSRVEVGYSLVLSEWLT